MMTTMFLTRITSPGAALPAPAWPQPPTWRCRAGPSALWWRPSWPGAGPCRRWPRAWSSRRRQCRSRCRPWRCLRRLLPHPGVPLLLRLPTARAPWLWTKLCSPSRSRQQTARNSHPLQASSPPRRRLRKWMQLRRCCQPLQTRSRRLCRCRCLPARAARRCHRCLCRCPRTALPRRRRRWLPHLQGLQQSRSTLSSMWGAATPTTSGCPSQR